MKWLAPSFALVLVPLLGFSVMGCEPDPKKDKKDKDECGDNCAPDMVLGLGQTFSCARSENGETKCWGDNWTGQLGLGDTAARGDEPNEMGSDLPAVDLGSAKPTALVGGSSHTCALLDDSSVKCWGRGQSGRLGLGDVVPRGGMAGEMGDSLPSVDLAAGVTKLTAGVSHNCALLDSGQVKCWGDNDPGALGLGDLDNRGDHPQDMGSNLPAVELGSGRTAVSISAGFVHSCALLDNAAVKCWGWNFGGKLGLRDQDDRGDEPGEMGDALPEVDLGSGRSAKALVSGSDHNCVILNNNGVKCWGLNRRGELGLGNTDWQGALADSMGDNLPEVELGSGRYAIALAAGTYFTCALLDNNTVKCWGNNEYGQLGQGDTENRGDEPDELGDNLPAIDLGAPAHAIAASGDHACALLEGGLVKCWGDNSSGELGLGDVEPRGDDGGEMGSDLPAISL